MEQPEFPAPKAPKLIAAIPRQSLSRAIEAFSEQTGLQFSYASGVAGELKSKGAREGLEPARALTQLLRGTGLQFKFVNSRTFWIDHLPAAPAPRPCAHANPEEHGQVIITGLLRSQALDAMPISAVVWTPEEMQAAGVKGMADLGLMTPGVEFDYFSSVGGGVYTNTALRGVTDRHGPATGVFIDGVAVPPTRSNTFARAFPAYFDQSFEVLRGPQGALLGANTQGGAILFMPNQPSLERSGLGVAEWSTTARGDPSHESGIAAGGPLVGGRVAYRASAWYRGDGGYVDRVDPFTGAIVDRDSNGTTTKSARGALSFMPVESVTITPSVSYQSTVVHDSAAFFTYLSNPQLGELENGSLLRQPFDDTFYVSTLRVEANLRNAHLSAITGYFHQTGSTTIDDTESSKWGSWDGRPPGFPANYSNAVTTYADLTQRTFSQEVRLRSADQHKPHESDRPPRWLLGAYYSRTRDQETDRVIAGFVPNFNGPLDESATTMTTQTQLAAFGLVSKTLWRLRMTAELRVEREEYSTRSVSQAPHPFPAFLPSIPPPSPYATQTLAVPKFTLAYEPGDHDLLYFSVAKGYAPGGVDAAMPTCNLPPIAYPTDTLWSYELGTKHSIWEEHDGMRGELAHLEASVFHIVWDNGPVTTGNCLFTHLPGAAESNGFDLSVQALLGWGVKTSVGISYIDARYTQTVTNGNLVAVRAGDAVGTPPFVTSPWNITLSLERRVTLSEGLSAGLRAQDVVHTRNPGPFYTADLAAGARYAPGLAADPTTNVLDLRADLQRHGLDVALFCNNVLDSQPTLLKRNKGDDTTRLFYATTFRPRTVGVTGSWHF
jgi:outer membrane receptor protein involved in Fe transport